MKQPHQDLDSLLADWPYTVGEVSARRAHGADGRQVLQLRVDLGVLQLEVSGRPDGAKPDGFATCYDMLVALSQAEGDAFHLDEARCGEIDREFVQYYHRRVAWLALREFREAVADADHTLALMDFSSAHAPDEDWIDLHEQYRPFVLFHRTQAEALAELEVSDPEAAVAAIDVGIAAIERVLAELDLADDLEEDEPDDEPDDEFDDVEATDADDEFLAKLRDLRGSILAEYELRASLSDQLADAIAREQYELAAELRDRIARRRHESRSSGG
ncbi:MAG: UvrB/UvrC motif-containing protein [Lacipirellulaceae bacterium]